MRTGQTGMALHSMHSMAPVRLRQARAHAHPHCCFSQMLKVLQQQQRQQQVHGVQAAQSPTSAGPATPQQRRARPATPTAASPQRTTPHRSKPRPATLLNLPGELVAVIGSFCDEATRRAASEAHRCFAPIHQHCLSHAWVSLSPRAPVWWQRRAAIMRWPGAWLVHRFHNLLERKPRLRTLSVALQSADQTFPIACALLGISRHLQDLRLVIDGCDGRWVDNVVGAEAAARWTQAAAAAAAAQRAPPPRPAPCARLAADRWWGDAAATAAGQGVGLAPAPAASATGSSLTVAARGRGHGTRGATRAGAAGNAGAATAQLGAAVAAQGALNLAGQLDVTADMVALLDEALEMLNATIANLAGPMMQPAPQLQQLLGGAVGAGAGAGAGPAAHAEQGAEGAGGGAAAAGAGADADPHAAVAAGSQASSSTYQAAQAVELTPRLRITVERVRCFPWAVAAQVVSRLGHLLTVEDLEVTSHMVTTEDRTAVQLMCLLPDLRSRVKCLTVTPSMGDLWPQLGAAQLDALSTLERLAMRYMPYTSVPAQMHVGVLRYATHLVSRPMSLSTSGAGNVARLFAAASRLRVLVLEESVASMLVAGSASTLAAHLPQAVQVVLRGDALLSAEAIDVVLLLLQPRRGAALTPRLSAAPPVAPGILGWANGAFAALHPGAAAAAAVAEAVAPADAAGEHLHAADPTPELRHVTLSTAPGQRTDDTAALSLTLVWHHLHADLLRQGPDGEQALARLTVQPAWLRDVPYDTALRKLKATRPELHSAWARLSPPTTAPSTS